MGTTVLDEHAGTAQSYGSILAVGGKAVGMCSDSDNTASNGYINSIYNKDTNAYINSITYPRND